MFGQNDNNQPLANDGNDNGSGTDFSKAMNDLAGGPQTAPPAWGHPGQPLDSGASDNSSPQNNIDDQAMPGPAPSDSFASPASDASSDVQEPVDNQAEGEMHVQSFDNPPTVHPSESASDQSEHSEGDLNNLIDLKQKALSELNPLVEHLDQNNEEKFNTLMMMIQASDDQSLIQQAYEVAQKITDEKARAQALLDVVNEINYFTQQQ